LTVRFVHKVLTFAENGTSTTNLSPAMEASQSGFL